MRASRITADTFHETFPAFHSRTWIEFRADAASNAEDESERVRYPKEAICARSVRFAHEAATA